MKPDVVSTLARGAFWTAVGRYSHYALQLIVTAVLSRLLDPADFGVLSMVVVYTGFVNVLAEAGLGSTVIQKRDLSGRDLSSVFWFAGGVALLLVLFTIPSAPWIERFFGFPNLSTVTRVTSLVFIFVALSAVPEGRLRRELRFKKVATINVLAAFLAGAIAVALAFAGAGYWALVGQILVAQGLKLVLLLAIGNWIPSLTLDYRVIHRIFGFSGYVVGFNSINYWARSADNLLIGRYLGAIQLGFYTQAYRLMLLPQQLLTGIISPALHPVLSTIQTDLPQVRQTYRKVLRLVICVSLPVSAFMFVMAPEMIFTVWGAKWAQSVPVFQYLALVTALQPAAATTGTVLMGANRADLYFKLGIFSTVTYVAGFVVTAPFGIVAVAQGYLVTNLIVTPTVLLFTYRQVLRGKPSDILTQAAQGFVLALAVGLGCTGIKLLLMEGPEFLRLLVSGILVMLILGLFLESNYGFLRRFRGAM